MVDTSPSGGPRVGVSSIGKVYSLLRSPVFWRNSLSVPTGKSSEHSVVSVAGVRLEVHSTSSGRLAAAY